MPYAVISNDGLMKENITEQFSFKTLKTVKYAM